MKYALCSIIGLLMAHAGLSVAQAQAARDRSVAEPRAESAPGNAVDTDEQARVLFEQGREAYAAARFEAALDLFRRAHVLSGRDALLYNIGQTADRLRRDREALEAFDRYLTLVPDAANRVEVEARVEVLRAAIAREEVLRAEAARPAAAVPAQVDAPIEEQWWFWTIIGVAVAGAGVGIGFAVLSREELAGPTVGDVGPGGVIVALEVR